MKAIPTDTKLLLFFTDTDMPQEVREQHGEILTELTGIKSIVLPGPIVAVSAIQ